MTVIAIRDGIMAVDSLAMSGDISFGAVSKWRKVPKKFGGGFIAAAGMSNDCHELMAEFCETGKMTRLDCVCTVAWLRRNGTWAKSDNGGAWIDGPSEYFAFGCGREIALGAMYQGATAEQAAKAAAALNLWCGGEIHVLSVNP